MADLLDRLTSKIKLTSDGCWLWAGARRTEYGVIRVGSQIDGTRGMAPAHRVLYELVVEPIPAGLEPDHLCKNGMCVNPDHIEPVTHQVNISRSDGFAGVNARKTHCINGHEFSDENTHIDYRGRRKCRACGRAYKARRDARDRAARIARDGTR